MTTPLLGLGGLVFADSLNPFNIGAVWSITLDCRRTRRSPTPGALSYIAGLYAFTAAYGLCMVLGIEAISRSIDFQVTPGVRYPVEFAAGALLIAAAWRLPNAWPTQTRRPPRSFPRQPRTLGIVGIGAAATQVPFSLPYLTLLGALSTADPAPSIWPVVVLGYAAAVQIPPILTLVLATRRTVWADRLQRSVVTASARYARPAIRVVLAVVGSALLADAILHHALYLSIPVERLWDALWHSVIGQWLSSKGLHIVIVVVIAILLARLTRSISARISRRLDASSPSDALVRSEYVKHRKAVASVISSFAIAIIVTVVSLDVLTELGIPVSSLAAPAAVVGAALGFGAQRIVQDVLAGFFVIVEKQYGFGDLVQLTIAGSPREAMGTVEDVTLRVTKLRNTDGEVSTIPNGQIIKSHNLSKDWARAVVDVPVPATADLADVNEYLHEVTKMAMKDPYLPTLLLDEPSVMGVESIEVDTVNLRMVARTLPGKQFEVSRTLRAMILSKLHSAGVDTKPDRATEVANL